MLIKCRRGSFRAHVQDVQSRPGGKIQDCINYKGHNTKSNSTEKQLYYITMSNCFIVYCECQLIGQRLHRDFTREFSSPRLSYTHAYSSENHGCEFINSGPSSSSCVPKQTCEFMHIKCLYRPGNVVYNNLWFMCSVRVPRRLRTPAI